MTIEAPQQTRRPTHRDVARLAGTSQATVSLVLSNRDAKVGISATTRQAVLAAARRVGYVADLGARRLRDARAVAAAPELTLAILRPKGTPIGLTARLIEAVSAGLAALAPSAQVVVEEFIPGRLAEHSGLTVASRFHGALLTSPTPEDEAFLEAPEGAGPAVPVVAFQRRPGQQAWVDVDNVAGAGEATRHLLARGRQRIAVIGWESIRSAAVEARLEGYREALRAAGTRDDGDELVVWAPQLSEQGGAMAGTALLERSGKQGVDGIVVLSDVLAVGVLHALRCAGRRTPQDVAVVGYDDLSFAPYLAPPLTSVRLPYDAMGREAAAWLVSAARGQAEVPLRRVFQPELVVRESSGLTFRP